MNYSKSSKKNYNIEENVVIPYNLMSTFNRICYDCLVTKDERTVVCFLLKGEAPRFLGH